MALLLEAMQLRQLVQLIHQHDAQSPDHELVPQCQSKRRYHLHPCPAYMNQSSRQHRDQKWHLEALDPVVNVRKFERWGSQQMPPVCRLHLAALAIAVALWYSGLLPTTKQQQNIWTPPR
eukprot:gnl/TRDRNA2_/TRDRNA2_177646_c4_seq11.p2 gnl/TRDRNA2_/TRDRNA2_177646_c4~~gnl/TRDRNA2_/TRDRNA2_177646_c4_seq11.p2  ORF type:complete len:120 (-),score=16.00 gnl/TRDRNA2_/TRDRNA2_177646_c4_seq11:97-456(-)